MSNYKNTTEKREPTSIKHHTTQTKAPTKNPAISSTHKKPVQKKNPIKTIKITKPVNLKKTPTQEKKKYGSIKYLGGLLFAKMLRGGTSELRSNAEEVNKLNVFPVPDGDTGDNMRMTIESGIAAIENLDTDDLADVMKVFSHGMLIGARGNSGVILSQFFAGMSKGLQSESKADPAAMARALEMGVEQAYSSVMTPTEGTILTVAREAVEYAVANMTPKSTIRSLFADLVKEMYASLNRTPEILKVLKDAGVVDSGGAGLFYIMDGINRVLNGEDVADTGKTPIKTASPMASTTGFGPDSEMTYGYCTEFLLQLQSFKVNIDEFDIEGLKTYLSKVGDSIVAFKTDSIVKVHVHTKYPERVLAHSRKYGEFLTIKIENMSVQHSENKLDEEQTNPASVELPTEPTILAERKKYGIVAVSNGEGISEVFREFGVDQIVEGGQTNNPSTGEFLEAFDKINAEHIFVLPNNGNIILAAEQSAEIYEKAKIHVIPAKNIGAGYVAVSTIDFESETPEQIIEGMLEAIERITTGYVSPSIRDADLNGIHINNGDTIGIIGKDIVVSDADRELSVLGLVAKLVEEQEKYMLTVFFGKDSVEEERNSISARIVEKYPSLEVYFIDGGQEIAPYIFVAE